jgi:sugar-specific transcriptional regulator TrmB/predicted hydrocarbon binding protein|tara:strand:- start:9544 stop:10908 length:1365 start_codon:yes stop_codon:yes gene_type:complete
MQWNQVLSDAGLSGREVNAVMVLSTKSSLKASELAKELGTTRLDAYNSLERLQSIGLVKTIADRPMRFSCPPIHDAVSHLISIRSEQLQKIESGYETLKSSSSIQDQPHDDEKTDLTNPKFAVLKERTHIMNRIDKMASEASQALTLVLGKFGILHLCRGTALGSVNDAAERGIEVRVLAQLDRRTIRFFSQLHDTVKIRHTKDLEAQGAIMDSSETIQYLNMEENPVGRGKNDAALIVESEPFGISQRNLVDSIWDDAIPFAAASKRFTEDRIVDPLKVTLEGGSFLDRFREVLEIEEDLPEEDTPFNPAAFLASSGEVNKARRKLSTGGVEEMSSFGINLADILRQVGTRIGEELAFSLRTIDGDIEFLNEMMDWWEHAGLGELSYGIDPEFHIKAMLVEESESPGSLPLHALDGGIIEGALIARYQGTNGVDVRRDEDPDGSLIYTLEMLE